MQNRIQSYQQDLIKEAEKSQNKKNREKAIMVESKDLHQRNIILRKKRDLEETLKESPKYLIDRELKEIGMR